VRYVLTVSLLLLVVASGCVSPKPRTDADEGKTVWSPPLDGPMPVRDSRRGGYWWRPSLEETGGVGNRGVLYSRGPSRRPPPAEREAPQFVQPVDLAPVVGHPVRVIERIVLNHVLFDYDRAELKPAGTREVRRVVRYLRDNPEVLVVVEGHTDWIASEKYNLALGARRANAVMQTLLDMGIAEERVATVSFGESRPVAGNETPEGRALNRRAVINLVVPDD